MGAACGQKLMLRLCSAKAMKPYIELGDIYYVALIGKRTIGVTEIRDGRMQKTGKSRFLQSASLDIRYTRLRKVGLRSNRSRRSRIWNYIDADGVEPRMIAIESSGTNLAGHGKSPRISSQLPTAINASRGIGEFIRG